MQALAERRIKELLSEHLPANTAVYLFGSRARNTHRWNSDFDLWVDGDVPPSVVTAILSDLEESVVPFKVDLVTTADLTGRFADVVRAEARRWV